MKKSLRNSLCRGTDSVATISSNKLRLKLAAPPFVSPLPTVSGATPSLITSSSNSSTMSPDLSPPPTLEEMLSRLEDEEESDPQFAELMMLSNFGSINPRRMSCVNNSDILRAAKSALNIQYPRFSVDGRDVARRPSLEIKSPDLARQKFMNKENDLKRSNQFPQGFREPSLIERLMGLETMPVHTPLQKKIARRPQAGANGPVVSRAFEEKKFDQKTFMVNQQKVSRLVNLEKQMSKRLLNHNNHPNSHRTHQGFYAPERSASRRPLGLQVNAAASSSSSYCQTKKLQAFTSKAPDLMPKRANYCSSNVMDEKKKSTRMCSNKVP